VQLGKLRADVHRIRALGADVFAISNDGPEDARRMATELGLDFPVLSKSLQSMAHGSGPA